MIILYCTCSNIVSILLQYYVNIFLNIDAKQETNINQLCCVNIVSNIALKFETNNTAILK